ncbi:terminase gpA endonuclease subunit [Paenibacillus larvae]|nr:terminase gpA endonuclease subunit [Paenibacillus larvae]MDT2269143.1 phage terminase large subunit family protein [Paenibacillus larvae]
MGWGAGHESWRIQYHKIYGDLKQPQVWTDLDEFLAAYLGRQRGQAVSYSYYLYGFRWALYK